MKIQILALAALPALAFAKVDMQSASFLHTETDFKNSPISRTYNSRSFWNGVFGLGWCADFEKRVDLQTGQIWHCDRPTNSFAKTDSKSRTWTATFQNQKTETYNYRGQVMKIMDSMGLRWDLSYDSQGRPSRVISSKMEFQFDYKNYRLQQIQILSREQAKSVSKFHPVVTYIWDQNQLVEVRKGPQVSKYKYDEIQNLTSILQSRDLPIRIEYDNQFDQVRAVKIGSCRQEFSFQKISKQKFQAVATTRCPSSVSRPTIFTFTARPLKTGKWKISGEKNESQLLP